MFMPVKRLWQSISWWRLNLALYLAIVGLVIGYRRDLLWAVHALPSYLRGRIEMTPERLLCVEAKELVEKGCCQEARELLQKSLAIDPTSESLYWLAECSYQTHQEEQAMQQFQKYLEIDPMLPETYLRIAELLMKKNQTQQARMILQKGISCFTACVQATEPHSDPSVTHKSNLKAILHQARCENGLKTLMEALDRLPGGGGNP